MVRRRRSDALDQRADRSCISRWAKQGFGEGVSGHITVVDPILPGHYWMNPFGVHFGRISVSNLVLVSPEGYPVEGGAQLPINTAGFHIRQSQSQALYLKSTESDGYVALLDSAIHKARPDVKAAAHCHSINGKAWSVFGKPIDLLTQDSCIFHDNLVSVFPPDVPRTS